MKNEKNASEDPIKILENALHELEVFSDPNAPVIEMGQDGKFRPKTLSGVEKMVEFTRHHLISFVSEKERRIQKEKQRIFKEKVLQILDIIKIHSPLLERCSKGNEEQKKLALYAFETIKKYNSALEKNTLLSSSVSHFCDYERSALLEDSEIKQRKIDLPRTLSVVYHSHPDASEELTTNTILEVLKPKHKPLENVLKTSFSSTVKDRDQMITETFLMKARRLVEEHLTQFTSLEEIYDLIKITPVEIAESNKMIKVQQLIEMGPGLWILITGAFRPLESKFMILPIRDHFRLSSQLTHSGFPYPSQSIGWTVGEPWVDANVIRSEHTPRFRELDSKKKELAERFLFDPLFGTSARLYTKKKKEIFDKHADVFLPLHRKLQELLREGFGLEMQESEMFDAFYETVKKFPSPYEKLSAVQQRIIALFIQEPLDIIEEEWLGKSESVLRLGSPDLRASILSERLNQLRQSACEHLDEKNSEDLFVLAQGSLLGEVFERIVLQYQSEKMGFAPPMLGDFERKLQAIAFHQLIQFFEEVEKMKFSTPSVSCETLKNQWDRLLSFFCEEEENAILPFFVVDELEVYFNSRFYQKASQL